MKQPERFNILDIICRTQRSHVAMLGISWWLEHGFRLCHGRPQLGALGNSAELSQGDEVEPDPSTAQRTATD